MTKGVSDRNGNSPLIPWGAISIIPKGSLIGVIFVDAILACNLRPSHTGKAIDPGAGIDINIFGIAILLTLKDRFRGMSKQDNSGCKRIFGLDGGGHSPTQSNSPGARPTKLRTYDS